MTRSPQAERLQPCMPPLTEEEKESLIDSQYSGAACENIVKSYFLSKGINIAEPYVDSGVDLLIEKPEGWVRGQVKKVVYYLQLDHGMKKRGTGEVYRPSFKFNYQSGGQTPRKHCPNGRSQKGPECFDYFYHVLFTPYRQIIWETPVDIIPLREDGNFICGKDMRLDSDSWKRKKADIDYRQLIIHSQYDSLIFKTYPTFFL